MDSLLQGKTLLVVDDRPENLLSLEALLEGSGADLVKVLSGQEALRFLYATQQKPHCVLLDVQMPEMSGYEVAALMKGMAATAQVPVIFVTANEEHGIGVDPEFAALLPDPVFVHKPLNKTLLLETLQRLL